MVVDAEVVEESGEEGSGGLIGATSDVESAGVGGEAAWLEVFGDEETIDVEAATGSVVDEGDAVPVAIGDGGIGVEGAIEAVAAFQFGGEESGEGVGAEPTGAVGLGEDDLSGGAALDPGEDAEGAIGGIDDGVPDEDVVIGAVEAKGAVEHAGAWLPERAAEEEAVFASGVVVGLVAVSFVEGPA